MTGGPGAVLVMGEALVDLVPVAGDGGVRTAQFGGAPANVAVGLARLGTPVSFAGGLGDDGFARMIEERLRAAGADVSLCARSGLPTALAVAEEMLDSAARVGRSILWITHGTVGLDAMDRVVHLEAGTDASVSRPALAASATGA